MKMITAIIKLHMLDPVHEALVAAGIKGMTVTEVKGFGRQKGQTEHYRGSQFQIEFLAKAKLEIAVADEQVETVTKALIEVCGKGEVGDGKIFIHDLDDVIRVRTGETGKEAI